MTKDEAITAVKEVTGMSLPWDDRHYEALQMAIEALNHIADDSKKVSISRGQENDMVYRQAVIDDLDEWIDIYGENKCVDAQDILKQAKRSIKKLPSAQPEPLSDAYMKAVWTWLLDYQIKVAELAGRYTPYEVLSWVANDWRKEHEGSD